MSEEIKPEVPDTPVEPQKKKAHPNTGMSYPNRLLRALETVYKDANASRAEKLQAIELSLEVLQHRTVPKRKTDKDKALEKILRQGTKKGSEPKPTP